MLRPNKEFSVIFFVFFNWQLCMEMNGIFHRINRILNHLLSMRSKFYWKMHILNSVGSQTIIRWFIVFFKNLNKHAFACDNYMWGGLRTIFQLARKAKHFLLKTAWKNFVHTLWHLQNHFSTCYYLNWNWIEILCMGNVNRVQLVFFFFLKFRHTFYDVINFHACGLLLEYRTGNLLGCKSVLDSHF